MSDTLRQDDNFFEQLARESDAAEQQPAPSRLKAKLLTSLLRKQEESGPLRTLSETRTHGYGLCIFEETWARMVSGDAAQSFNCCSVCHARALAEHIERAPLYWGHCPYTAFSKK